MTVWKNHMAGCLLALLGLMPLLAHGLSPMAPTDAARDAAQNFYQKYQRMRGTGKFSGIPNPAQLAQIAPLITPQLRTLFVAAFKEQSRCRKLFPEDIPPWVDGDMFSSNTEGFTAFVPLASEPVPGGRTVSMRFSFIDKQSRVVWNDTLSLQASAGPVWLVDDVLYRATFAYTSGFGASLQGALKELPAC